MQRHRCPDLTVLGNRAAGPVTRSVNEEALECASCEAIGRVLTLPCSRVGLLATGQLALLRFYHLLITLC